jgi:alginate O-acetyltransferase complex protein AlgI
MQVGSDAAWFAAAAYALQIYFDFAGYSNMAIGLGRMMGFTFPINFDRPYTAPSVTEFWRRWHMSLSSWFRDYLYVPLGGNRGSEARTYVNLAIVFLLCGLWHGAAWNFVAWGAWHGALLIVERSGLARHLASLPVLFQRLYLLGTVTFGWVLFRADDLPHAGAMIGAMFGTTEEGGDLLALDAVLTPSIATAFALGALIATSRLDLWAFEPASRLGRVTGALQRPAAFAALLLCAFSLSAGTYNPFIYFRF